eukprot:scaffold4.g4694.t1
MEGDRPRLQSAAVAVHLTTDAEAAVAAGGRGLKRRAEGDLPQRRLFGNLLGRTLAKARQEVETSAQTDTTQRREELLRQAEERKRTREQELKEQANRERAAFRQDEQRRRWERGVGRRVARIEQTAQRIIARREHQQDMRFIRTETAPCLLWQPAVPCKATEALRAAQQAKTAEWKAAQLAKLAEEVELMRSGKHPKQQQPAAAARQEQGLEQEGAEGEEAAEPAAGEASAESGSEEEAAGAEGMEADGQPEQEREPDEAAALLRACQLWQPLEREALQRAMAQEAARAPATLKPAPATAVFGGAPQQQQQPLPQQQQPEAPRPYEHLHSPSSRAAALMVPPFRGLLVDAAGTLLLPSEPAAEVYLRYAARYGCCLTADQILQRFRVAYNTPWPDSAIRRGQQRDVLKRGWYVEDGRPFWRFIVRESTGCEAAFEEIYEYYARGEAWTLAPGAVACLQRMRDAGMRIALVSNFDTRLRRIMAEMGLNRLFDAVVEAEKPNPRIFEAACAALGLPPEACVHVGDDRRNDVFGARDAGCFAWLWGQDVHSFRHGGAGVGRCCCRRRGVGGAAGGLLHEVERRLQSGNYWDSLDGV